MAKSLRKQPETEGVPIRLSDFISFIKKREAIRLARVDGKPPPWTNDWILQTYKFCNVRRKDDRVTQWIIKNVLNKYDQNIPFITLCRFVNWPPTIAALIAAGLHQQPLNWRAIGKLLDRREEKTWTGAYMIKGHPKGKGVHIASSLGKGFRKNDHEIMGALSSNYCRNVHAALQLIPECGTFLAGQVVADLTYTHWLEGAYDLLLWAPLGPGSRRGYNRLLNLPLQSWPDENTFNDRLVEWRKDIIRTLGDSYTDLTLHDVQNCLCEFDKYVRTKNGEGRPRSNYVPETRFTV